MSTQERSRQQSPSAALSQASHQASPHEIIGVGIAFAAAGLYFILGAATYLPMPEPNGPNFLGYCIGAAFLFAGLTCIVRARIGKPSHESHIPESVPRWPTLSYQVMGIGIAGAVTIIGTWIAIGLGPRAFNLSVPLLEMQTAGEVLGRTIFWLGAVIAWIFVIAFVIGTVRKLFDRRVG